MIGKLLPAALVIVAVGVPIGSELSSGTQLYYESGGTVQEPWVYQVVEVIEGPEFERWVRVVQEGQTPVESCVRGDTLYESRGGEHRTARPIGPGMRMEIEGATQIIEFTTGEFASREIDGAGQVEYLSTTIISRTHDGVATRRLTEEYSTGYLTALRGVFESPDGPDGWTVVQEFELAEVRR